jgi:RNA polymerase sigma-70 factor (ECF subfamily)
VEDETMIENEQYKYEHVLEELGEKELLEMIQELSVQYRMVFNLYAIEGYSHKEISKKLNISEGTSKSNLSRARELLKSKIETRYKIKLGKVI